MGIPERDFWTMPLCVWLAALDAWASQYPDPDEDVITPEQAAEMWASLSPAERASLGLEPTEH